VRLWRVPSRPRSTLVLQDGERYLDLEGLLGEAARDLVGLLAADFFSASRLDSYLREGDWREVPAPAQVLTPLEAGQVGKILALGKNFRAHAAEFGEEAPAEPIFFPKLPETLSAHADVVRVPPWYAQRFDHEVELAVIIGQGGRDIDPAKAFGHVAAYTLANDLTARSLQGRDRKQGHPWLRAKNFPGACPLGPCLVPRDNLDVSDLRLTCRVQRAGTDAWETRQDASTRDWIADIPAALAFLSRHLPLNPGDIVLMGTPEGVGALEHGDLVVCAAEGIGELATRIERPGA